MDPEHRDWLQLSTLNNTEASLNNDDEATLSKANERIGSKNEVIEEGKPSDNQYPHGVKLMLLGSASIIAIFLIALDQVRIHLSLWALRRKDPKIIDTA